MKKLFISFMVLIIAPILVTGCSTKNSAKKETSKTVQTVPKKKIKKTKPKEKKVDKNSTEKEDSQSKTPEESSKSSTIVDNKTAGVLAAIFKLPEWFKQNFSTGYMYYYPKVGNDYGEEVANYSLLSSEGDPTGQLFFKVEGDNITMKNWVPGNQGVADGHYVTQTVTLARLENDYYSNQAQKEEINNYVNNLGNPSNFQQDHQ